MLKCPLGIVGRLVLTLALMAHPASTSGRVSAAGTAGSTAGLSERLNEMGRSVEARRNRLRIPGLAIVVVQDDTVVYLKGFGLRDVARRLPVTPDTLFGIGSCTKAFTAMAAVMSADDGKLALDDPPRKFLPYFHLTDPEADANVTLRDLLCHRTGLKAYDDGVWHKNARLSREAVIKAVMLKRPTARFRKEFQYNNVMYSAAGECIARAQGSTWEEVIARRIFEPLGMKTSNTSIAAMRLSADFAVGYQGPGKSPKREAEHDLTNVAPAGAINSSAREMGEWIRLMLGEGVVDGRRLVSERSYRELVSPQIATEAGASYGLGWELGLERGRRYLAHDGGAVGHAAHVWLSPEEHRGWAVLANVNDGPQFKEIARRVDSYLLTPADEPGRNTPLLAAAGILGLGLMVWGRRRLACRAEPPSAE